MRKSIIASMILLLLVLPVISINGAIENPLRSSNFEEFIDRITNGLFWLGIAVAPMFILIAAFYLLTAAGNTAQIETGKRIIVYTLAGILILIMAKGVIAFMFNIF